MKKLIVIVGPTAVGKSAIAMELARELNVSIFSADARQFYKEMNIGTAKPSEKDRTLINHFFINNLSIEDSYSAGDFERDCIKELDNYFNTNDIAILCGGSGLFVNAVLYGLEDKTEISSDIRDKVRNLTLSEMQEKLQSLDSEYYKKVDKMNGRRLSRALELVISSGKKMSEQLHGEIKKRKFDFQIYGVCIDRDGLYERINKRVDEMIQNGLEDEVYSLKDNFHLNALKTVGYQEWVPFFNGTETKEKVIEKIKQNTRNYAKRQITWFKKMENVNWLLSEIATTTILRDVKLSSK